jgi:hypothetical protein
MKNFAKFNESVENTSVRNMMTPKSPEEIDLAIKNEWQRMLDVADQTGTSKSKMQFLSTEFDKYTENNMFANRLFNVDISYVLYKNKVYEMTWIPGGDYYVELYKIPKSTDELKNELKSMLKKLE